jgi:hypothetical protein
VPVLATATNRLNPGDQTTERQLLASAAVCASHVSAGAALTGAAGKTSIEKITTKAVKSLKLRARSPIFAFNFRVTNLYMFHPFCTKLIFTYFTFYMWG